MEDGNRSMEMEQDRRPLPLQSSSRSEKTPGGWRAIKYILGNESFEKLASMSLVANITVYLRTKYNMEGVFLVNVITIWSGSSNIASIPGAFISDAYLGRFLTLLCGSIASFLGMGTFTISAAVPQLRPPPCAPGQDTCPEAHGWQLGFLFAGLGLLVIGAGGIRPCNIAFGADQFDTTTARGRTQLESFFNWWYLSFTIALLVVLTLVVYIQTNISWVMGFAIPTACFALSITIFLLGRKTYIYIKPQGSVFVDVVKVINAAFHKRGTKRGADGEKRLYDPPLDMSKQLVQKLDYTDKFAWLDKAAIVIDANLELDGEGLAKNNWRLCSVQQVEQLKRLLGVLPVLVSAIACFIAMDQQNIFGILQAIQSNKFLWPGFEMPPGWMGLTSMIALSIWILVYERVYMLYVRHQKKKDARLTMPQRVKTGIIMSILCMIVAGLVEIKRREAALKHGSFTSPLSVLALLPQFILSGLTEAFAAITIMEFFTMKLPESMRTVAGAIFFVSLSIASYFSSFIVNMIHWIGSRNGHTPWIGGHDLNKNKLERYYFLIAGVAVMNFFYFTFFASKYVVIDGENSAKKVDDDRLIQGKDEEKGVEIATN